VITNYRYCARCKCVVGLSDCHLTGYCSGAGGECGCPLYVSSDDPRWKDLRIAFLEEWATRYTKRYVDELTKRRKAEDIVRKIKAAFKALDEMEIEYRGWLDSR
jgi:hypothetical protein